MNVIRRRLQLEVLEGRETPASVVPVPVVFLAGEYASPPRDVVVMREVPIHLQAASPGGGAVAPAASQAWVSLPPPRPGLLLPD